MGSSKSPSRENRNFEIYFDQTEQVAKDIGSQSNYLGGVASKLSDIANKLTGSGAIAEVRSAVRKLSNETYNHSQRMLRESQTIDGCVYHYKKAEASLLGRKVTESSLPTSSGGGGGQNIPTQQKSNEKPGQKKKTSDNSSSDISSLPTMGWVEDFDVVSADGNVIHYKKAYINRGKVVAYYGKTSWKSSFLDDYKIVSGSVLLKQSGDPPTRKVWVEGQGWVKASDQEGLAKKILPILSANLFTLEGEATLLGAEASGEEKWGSYKASAKLLTASGSLNIAAGTFLHKNPDGTYSTGVGVSATATASAAVIALSASGFLGNTKTGSGVMGSADTKVLAADATGDATVGWVQGKGPQVTLTGEVGAKLVEAKGSAGVALAKGLSAKVTGSVQIGVGATGSIGYSDGKFHVEFGAALGLGFKISFDIDLSGAVDAIVGAAKSVYNAYWSYVKLICGEEIANRAKSALEDNVKNSDLGKTVSSTVSTVKHYVHLVKNVPPKVILNKLKDIFGGW